MSDPAGESSNSTESGAKPPPNDRHSTRIVIIRHGHISANIGGVDAPMAGWADVPLSAEGREQIRRLTKYLAGGAPFDAIYASPLSRARDTAEAVAAGRLDSLHVCDGLKEINCGEVDGVPIGEVQRRFPRLWEENERQDCEDFRWPGGESYREFRDRSVLAVECIAAKHPGGRVAVVTHAGVISQIVGYIRGLSPARWEAFRPGNASISEITWRKSSGVLVSFDCRDHLQVQP